MPVTVPLAGVSADIGWRSGSVGMLIMYHRSSNFRSMNVLVRNAVNGT